MDNIYLPINGCTDSTFNILVVDDDAMVHMVTEMSFNHLQFTTCSFKLHSAYSAKEAVKKLQAADIKYSVILLDIVMETLSAGLDIIPDIRKSPAGKFARIIVRTGQAGRTAREDIIAQHEIHGYYDKVSLDTETLLTAAIIGIRNYIDIVGERK